PIPVTTTRRFICYPNDSPHPAAFRCFPECLLSLERQKKTANPANRICGSLIGSLARSGCVCLHVINGGLHSADLLGFFVGNLSLEFLFQSHDQLNCIQRVSAQIFNKGSLGLHIFRLHAKLLDDDLDDSLFNATHDGLTLLCWCLAP